MRFDSLASFGYFNRHFRTRVEKGRKEIRATFPSQARFTVNHLNLYCLYRAPVAPAMVFHTRHISGMCRDAWKEEGRARKQLPLNHLDRIGTLAQTSLSNKASYLGIHSR